MDLLKLFKRKKTDFVCGICGGKLVVDETGRYLSAKTMKYEATKSLVCRKCKAGWEYTPGTDPAPAI